MVALRKTDRPISPPFMRGLLLETGNGNGACASTTCIQLCVSWDASPMG